MKTNTEYADLLVAYQPAKPRNRQELAEMTCPAIGLSVGKPLENWHRCYT